MAMRLSPSDFVSLCMDGGSRLCAGRAIPRQVGVRDSPFSLPDRTEPHQPIAPGVRQISGTDSCQVVQLAQQASRTCSDDP